jgi:radical SAM superfamily enzyme YgiQ (UPF0313 family)
VKILLLSCYESGHQPLGLAWPLAFLEEAGFRADAVDFAVESLLDDQIVEAELVGISVPMHTALRLGVEVAIRIRTVNPLAHICFFGHYAWLNAEYLLGGDDPPPADSVLSAEFEQALVALAETIGAGGEPADVPGVTTLNRNAPPILNRQSFPIPNRSSLPEMGQYARFQSDGIERTAGYVEASRGCLHTCTHCPVVPIYNGRFFVVPAETVLADIRQQVAKGAGHISFGDPDFLNGPGHVLKIVRSMHEEFPGLTFDFTTKVEHILQRRTLFPELRELGAAFVVSAFESVSDLVLAKLEKGHDRSDLDVALAILRHARLPVRPTWVPFTPWTTLADYLDLLHWIRRHGLIPNIPVVQLSVRLLIPPNSALLKRSAIGSWLGPQDPANFVHRWQHPEPRMDKLQRMVADYAENMAHGGDAHEHFAAIEALAHSMAGRLVPEYHTPTEPEPAPPRLTEDWFC